ncbi:MAG: 2Fe-2S iron-sulfur cluster-binding protein, partial [Brevefilum sp.]|nr:2Fe-2S iron-sulfur cluster-binding protein [Brevefilum sp.]
MDKEINIVVNGKDVRVNQKFFDWSLVKFLREELRLTGTKQGCDSKGTCGLCKVIINGRARISCVGKMASLDTAVIETIENLVVHD